MPEEMINPVGKSIVGHSQTLYNVIDGANSYKTYAVIAQHSQKSFVCFRHFGGESRSATANKVKFYPTYAAFNITQAELEQMGGVGCYDRENSAGVYQGVMMSNDVLVSLIAHLDKTRGTVAGTFSNGLKALAGEKLEGLKERVDERKSRTQSSPHNPKNKMQGTPMQGEEQVPQQDGGIFKKKRKTIMPKQDEY